MSRTELTPIKLVEDEGVREVRMTCQQAVCSNEHVDVSRERTDGDGARGQYTAADRHRATTELVSQSANQRPYIHTTYCNVYV